MTSMVQRCPPEILSAVCKIVANDDMLNNLVDNEKEFKNLKSFSQTCRTFLPYCRDHIFRSINIHDSYNPKDRTAELFTRLIEGTPEIANYVRSLRYGMRFHDRIHYRQVVSALDRLTALNSITLNIQGYRRSWNKIPPATQSSLLRLIRLPSLVSLELRSIRDLNINLLPPCPNLQNLHLQTITFSDEEKATKANSEASPIISVGSIRPRELRIAKTPEHEKLSFSMLFDQQRADGQPIFDVSGLKSVSFYISKGKDLELMRSILSSAPQLEILEIIGETYLMMKYGAACIQESQFQLSALKSLFFKVYLVAEFPPWPSHPLPGICQALSNIAAKNSIQVIKIDVIMYQKFYFTEGDQWADLDRSLTTTEWPSLRHVQLDIVSHARRSDCLGKLRNHLDTQFPTLSLQQNFKFDLNVSGC